MYVLSQMDALEAEQNHIDNRAAVVERKLRNLLETGAASIVCYGYTASRANAAQRLR